MRFLFSLSILLSISFSSYSQKDINKKLNDQYRLSRKTILGELTEGEFQRMKELLSKELNITIPDDKSIIINYDQNAPNCLAAGFSKKYNKIIMNNGIQLSGIIARDNNSLSEFVYTKDCHNNELYSKNSFFKLDSGFFYNTIFTIHENCSAFYILKPNRKYMIYYGEDYYTKVKNFLIED